MEMRMLSDALEAYMSTQSLPDTQSAHLRHTQYMLDLAVWLEEIDNESDNYKAVKALTFRALWSADRYHYTRILGIVAIWQGL